MKLSDFSVLTFDCYGTLIDWESGMVAGLIDDVPSCQELVDRIMTQAEGIIRDRLAGL